MRYTTEIWVLIGIVIAAAFWFTSRIKILIGQLDNITKGIGEELQRLYQIDQKLTTTDERLRMIIYRLEETPKKLVPFQ